MNNQGNTNTRDDSLSSRWDGLSQHLIATFYELKRDGAAWVVDHDAFVVKTVFTEASMEMAVNWQSQFENTGVEAGFPAITAMLQTNALQPFLDKVGMGKSELAKNLSSFAGKSGVTKLNSTQVFTGMPPVKFQVTALFRAWKDPGEEVEEPFSQLVQWALPKQLSPDGTLIQIMNGEIMATFIPSCIQMTYKGRTYGPLVIESISQPLNSPVDGNGNFVELLVQMSICSLSAIDRKDWLDWHRAAAW